MQPGKEGKRSLHRQHDYLRRRSWGTSLAVQWLRCHTPNARGLGLILGQQTRLHILRLRVHRWQLKVLHATTKIQCSQINDVNLKAKKIGFPQNYKLKISRSPVYESSFHGQFIWGLQTQPGLFYVFIFNIHSLFYAINKRFPLQVSSLCIMNL